MKKLNCVFVNPEKKNSQNNSGNTIPTSSQKIKEFLEFQKCFETTNFQKNHKKCKILFIFPEGGTTNGTKIMKFRTGAFFPGIPVVPMIIKYG